MEKEFLIKDKDQKRLDIALNDHFTGFSRSYFQGLIDKQLITVNGKKVKKRERVKEGDLISCLLPETPDLTLIPQNIDLDILFEDEHIICINKKAGMVTHPAPGHPKDTCVNALLYHCKTLPLADNPIRPGIVHRLDKETSGLLIAAKTDLALKNLIRFFSERKIKKQYLAITLGHPKKQTVDAPIGRNPRHRKEMAINKETGKEALTKICPLKKGTFFSLVSLEPITGRTHQIRVHLKSIKTPVLGDKIYGSLKTNRKMETTRLLLHAFKIEFPHPITGDIIKLSADIPKEMLHWIDYIS